jgi:hypothetical protein
MLYLILILLLVLILGCLRFKHLHEGYSNYNLAGAEGAYPSSQTSVLVQDSYPPIGVNQISNDGAADIWWHYPSFSVGSYKQITNNIRYSNNPDVGRCTPASMCGALYHDKQLKSNYIEPLPPVNPNCGTRVGYFSTSGSFLPYRTDMQNILY